MLHSRYSSRHDTEWEPLAGCRIFAKERRRAHPAYLLALLLLGCGPSIQQLNDGTLVMQCRASLAACTGKASRYCQAKGCEILEGSEDRDSSRVVFRCQQQATPKLINLIVPGKTGHSPAASAGSAGVAPSVSGPPANRPAVPLRVCVPGSTQRCVGIGGCPGGQACLPDGTGFGRCECSAVSTDAGRAADAQTDSR
jgi:hypothetical protein